MRRERQRITLSGEAPGRAQTRDRPRALPYGQALQRLSGSGRALRRPSASSWRTPSGTQQPWAQLRAQLRALQAEQTSMQERAVQAAERSRLAMIALQQQQEEAGGGGGNL